MAHMDSSRAPQAMQSALTRTPLQHSEDRFRLLVEAVRDYAIFMLDRKATSVLGMLARSR